MDFLHARRFPGTLSGYTVDEYEAALATVDALDFDILLAGHGNSGTKADVSGFLAFLRALESDVMAGIAEGLDRETLQQTILLADYSDWLLYEERRANIVGEMYDRLTACNVDLRQTRSDGIITRGSTRSAARSDAGSGARPRGGKPHVNRCPVEGLPRPRCVELG